MSLYLNDHLYVFICTKGTRGLDSGNAVPVCNIFPIWTDFLSVTCVAVAEQQSFCVSGFHKKNVIFSVSLITSLIITNSFGTRMTHHVFSTVQK